MATEFAPWQIAPGFVDTVHATKNGLPLEIRIWKSPNAKPNAPWCLWSHGGGFIACSHRTPMPWVFPGFLDRGVHIASYAYRFQPHAGVPDMIEDSQDALAWCRQHLAEYVGSVDIDRYFTAGESAGGTMSALNGHVLSPRPRAVVDVYGVMDFSDPHFEGPPDFPMHNLCGKFSIDELTAAMNDRDVTKAIAEAPHIILGLETAEQGLDRFRFTARAPSYEFTDRQWLQNDLMSFIMGSGNVMQCYTRREAFPDEESWKAAARKLSPLGRLDGATGPDAYPPTFFLHGMEDKSVPYPQSLAMAKRLRELGVPIGESYEAGMDHVFDLKYTSEQVPGWTEYIEPLVEFVFHHLGETSATKESLGVPIAQSTLKATVVAA